jgi:putative DNA primase/helicase
MSGEVVPLLKSAEQIAADETKSRKAQRAWAVDLASKVIRAALEDAAIRFLDNVDDEELGSPDLEGEYNPIIDEKTGTRLSDAIEEFAETIQLPEKTLRRLYAIALKEKWKEQKKEIPTDPAGTSYGPTYMTNRHGVWTKLNAGGSDLYVWRRIARTKIDPVALSRDTSPQRNWRHRYRITDETGEFLVEIANEHLAKKADRAISVLMRHGVHVVETDDARQHLASFLRYKPRDRVIRAPRVGWFEAKKDWVFVLPNETLSETARADIVLDVETQRHGFHRSGTSEQWRKRVAEPLAGNSNVVLAVGTFLAAPLLRWADEPGGGFHFHGPAKIGKTLLGSVGQSVWGKPYAPGAGADAFGYTWESTANRIGQRAVLRSDVGLYLDEIGIGDRNAVASAVYKLAGGLDKGRYGQAERDFNILFLSTGELSLAEFLPNARQGQLVRLVDIPAVVQSESVFETISKDKVAAAGRQFYAATNEYHGSVGYDWLRHLITLTPKRIKTDLKWLREKWWALPQVAELASRAHPQVVSVVNRFALVAAALNMASEAGIVPWAVADIDAAIIACVERWLSQRGNIDTAGELLREIRRRRQMFAATIGDRFIHLGLRGRRLVPSSAADQRKMDAEQQFDGYVKERRILVRPDAWRRLWAGLDADAVKEQLRRAELLIAGPNGDVPSLEKFKSNAPPARFYVLAPAFVEPA